MSISTLRAGFGWLPGAGVKALDLLLPPRCFGCGVTVPRQGELCGGCWSALRFVQPPFCFACGRPFEHDLAGQLLCAACAQTTPVYDRARAALVYDDGSRSLIL